MVAEHGFARRIADVLIPLITEEIVEIVKVVFQERIAERICEQIVSQVAEQDTEAPKTSSRDRTLQRAVEQIPDVLVPEVVTQLLEVPKIIPQDRIQQRTVEQIVDAPVPQTVKELTEVSKVFSQDRIHKRFVEQIIETPSTAIAEMIVTVPVIQTPSVQHVVDAVDVEKPKIIELTVQRKKFTIQEKINQETKPGEFPQAQFSDKAGDIPVVVQRQVSEVPPLQFTDKVSDIPVAALRQIPIMVQTIQKTTLAIPLVEKIDEMPVTQKTQQVANTHVQHVVNAVEAEMPRIIKETVQRKRPVINEKINQMTKHHEVPQSQVMEKTVEGQQLQIVGQFVETGQSTQTFERLGTAPVCRSTQAEIVKAVEIEVPIPAESASLMSVQRVQKTVEVPQIQFIDKLVDSHANMRSVPEVEHVVPTPMTEHMASAPAQSHADVSAGVKSDITWTKELAEIRQMVEFLVRRERKLDAKN